MTTNSNPAQVLFAPKGADEIYAAILARLRGRIGAKRVVEDPKQTCVHLIAGEGGPAYAGLHPRKGAVLLTIRTQAPLVSERVRKAEQVSRNRCHCDLLVSSAAEVDDELIGWLEQASLIGSQSEPRGKGKPRKA